MTTLKKINLARFTEECRDNRELALALVGTNPMIKSYRDALNLRIDWDRVSAKEPVAAPKTTADTLAELVDSYQTAAMITGSYIGASPKQAAFLARLHWAEGERRLWTGQLTKREASAMIGVASARA